jgi:ATP-dependent RNA helicase RhlE
LLHRSPFASSSAPVPVPLTEPAPAAFSEKPASDMRKNTHPVTDFASLGLAEPILAALRTTGYTAPTPIQAQAIPYILAGQDLQGIAQTGTGKTAAFALPIIHRLMADRKPRQKKSTRVLILSPTRELAGQIAENIRIYARQSGLRTALMFGGVSKVTQSRAVAEGVDILVATPGRLLDHLNDGAIRLDQVEIFVLDEADHMLDLGFIVPIRKLAALLPKPHQTLFFSATMPKEIASLAAALLKNPVHASVAPVATTVERVEQQVVFIDTARKRQMLSQILKGAHVGRTLVFTRTKHGADRVVKHLEDAGQPAVAIHGNKSQSQRERALAQFKNGHIRVLVATDIAARGIDVDGVTHVINFDLPAVAESYVHRIGRTARAGAAGVAISFCDQSERSHLRGIEKLIRTTLSVVRPESLAA